MRKCDRVCTEMIVVFGDGRDKIYQLDSQNRSDNDLTICKTDKLVARSSSLLFCIHFDGTDRYGQIQQKVVFKFRDDLQKLKAGRIAHQRFLV